MNRHDVHEIMDILSAICTIIVSIVAVWGSISLWSSDFMHKCRELVDHYHSEMLKYITEK